MNGFDNMKEITILPADTYTVINKTILDDKDHKIISMLYQPIIGYSAVSLYETLVMDLEKSELISDELTHHHLISTMQLSLDEIVIAREKLEAVGLLKTYLKKNYPYEYRNILRTKIIPRLHKFKPDIIFISAGFDGHKMELINQNSMLLQENDFGYIAEQIQFVANKFCQGRLVAVLEGGYNAKTATNQSFRSKRLCFC